MIKIIGKMSEELSSQILPSNKQIFAFFVDYSNDTIKKNTFFKEVHSKGLHEFMDCELVYITNESFFELDQIDEGYKTICFFKFYGTIPKIVLDIPYVEDWYDYNDFLSLTTFS